MSKNVSVLWTGGWDSTFRLVELSFEDVDVYPVYVVDPARKSNGLEQAQMKRIIAALEGKPLTKARFHDVETIPLDTIPQDEEITEAFKTIHAKTHLGKQHEWLARLGKIRPGMEMGTEAGNVATSHILYSIQEFGKLVIGDDGIGALDPQLSSREGMLVLGWFRFPIITRTENDMLALIKQWGYEDVMQNIWFCHTPVNGSPCGICHACAVKMESNMTFLLPKKAQRKYKFFHTYCRIFGNFGKRHVEKLIKRI